MEYPKPSSEISGGGFFAFMKVTLSPREFEFLKKLPNEKRKNHFLRLKQYLQSEDKAVYSDDRISSVVNKSRELLNELYRYNLDDLYQEEFLSLDSRNTPEYRNWRQLVLERDNYICVDCGSPKKVQAHHIKSWLKHRELRYEVGNGQALCHKCHVKTDNYGIKARNEAHI